MSEVKLNGPLFKVTMTKYERGYGHRLLREKFFTTEAEAKQYCKEYNADLGDPDCYYRADYRKVA